MEANRLKQILQDIQDTTVIVVGDVMLDEYVFTNATKLSQEAPVPVLVETGREVYGGGAANAAANIAALGADAYLYGVCGWPGDETHYEIEHWAKEVSERLHLLLDYDDTRPTTQKMRIVASGQQVCRLDREVTHPIGHETVNRLLDGIRSHADSADAFLVSDYGKGAVTKGLCEAVLDCAEQHNLPVVIDPKPEHHNRYAGATLLTPNADELRGLVHAIGSSYVNAYGRESMALRLLHDLNVEAVLVTCGEDGMMLRDRSGNGALRLKATGNDAIDVTGAGDTVAGVVAACLGAKVSMAEAAEVANLAAGIVVRKRGCGTASPDEITAAVVGA